MSGILQPGARSKNKMPSTVIKENGSKRWFLVLGKILPFGICFGSILCLLTIWTKRAYNIVMVITLTEIFTYHTGQLIVSNLGKNVQTLVKSLWQDSNLHYLIFTYFLLRAGLIPKLLFVDYGCMHGIIAADILDTDVGLKRHGIQFIRKPVSDTAARKFQALAEILMCPYLTMQALIQWDRLMWLAVVIDVVVFLMFAANSDKTHIEIWNWVNRKLDSLSHRDYSIVSKLGSLILESLKCLDHLGKCLYCDSRSYA